MKCPSCNNTLPRTAPACPECGFELADLASRFGAIPRYNALLTDTTGGSLTARSFKRTRKYLQFFDRRFPQMRFSAFIHPLGPGVPIREYTFYIHNTCRFTPYERHDVYGSILLFIDPNNRRACLMVGYGLEDLLSEDQLNQVLMSSTANLQRGRFGDAIITCVKATMAALKPGIKNRSRASKPGVTLSSTTQTPEATA